MTKRNAEAHPNSKKVVRIIEVSTNSGEIDEILYRPCLDEKLRLKDLPPLQDQNNENHTARVCADRRHKSALYTNFIFAMTIICWLFTPQYVPLFMGVFLVLHKRDYEFDKSVVNKKTESTLPLDEKPEAATPPEQMAQDHDTKRKAA